MKALLLNGSPHAHGGTQAALEVVAHELEKNGIETEIVHVGHKQIHGCIACYKCFQTGECVFKDIVGELAPKFEQADGIVIGTPVYYSSPAGTLISFLDRFFYSTHFDKRMKVGATVVTSRRAGSVATFDVINKYFMISQMPVVSSQYWNEAYPTREGSLEQDPEGEQTMRVLGRNMAFLIKAIAAEKEKNGLPEPESSIQKKLFPNSQQLQETKVYF